MFCQLKETPKLCSDFIFVLKQDGAINEFFALSLSLYMHFFFFFCTIITTASVAQ